MNKKILIIGPSWLGDMVMAQSLFKLIKELEPATQIDVVAPSWSLPVLERMPEISKSICLPINHGIFALKQRIAIAKQIKQQGYAQAIVLPNSWKSALIPWLAGIKLRTGWLGECRWGLLNDVRYLDKHKLPKLVERYCALALAAKTPLPAMLPMPKLKFSQADVAALAQKYSLDLSVPVLALCPGAAYGPAKRWLPEYFVEIAQNKIAQGWQVWLLGAQQDSQVIEQIQSHLPKQTFNFAGKLSLVESLDLLSQAAAVVSNDSGMLHITASLDRPLVAIYGSTSPAFTPPLGLKTRVLKQNLACSPCFKRECPLKHFNCMKQIEPQQVIEALESLERV
jgi:heptosyltransferase-2